MAGTAINVRWALAFVFVTVFLNSAGFGIIIPVLPELIVDITGEPLHQAARYSGWLAFAYASMQFFFAPFAGNLSDTFGRRPVLLVSLCIFGVYYLIMGFAPTLAWLFVGRIVAGMTATSFGIGNACIADLFPPDERAQNFGLIGAAFGAGFIVGPAIGGFLGEFGPRTPFFATAAIAFANALFGLLAMPETLRAEDRRPFEFGRANPFGALRQVQRIPVVGGMLGAFFLYMLAQDSLPAIWAFYTMERFDWGPREVGVSLGTVGACIFVVQGLLIRKAIPLWGEPRTAYVGLALAVAGFFGFALSSTGWAMYLSIVVLSGCGLIMPAMNGIMSKRVPDNAQGELQGVLGSLASASFVVSPVVMTQLFGYFSSPAAPVYFPGVAFVLASLLTACSAVTVAVALARTAHTEQP